MSRKWRESGDFGPAELICGLVCLGCVAPSSAAFSGKSARGRGQSELLIPNPASKPSPSLATVVAIRVLRWRFPAILALVATFGDSSAISWRLAAPGIWKHWMGLGGLGWAGRRGSSSDRQFTASPPATHTSSLPLASGVSDRASPPRHQVTDYRGASPNLCICTLSPAADPSGFGARRQSQVSSQGQVCACASGRFVRW